MSGERPEPPGEEPAFSEAGSVDAPGHAGVYYLFRDIDNAEAERFCSALWAGASLLSRVPDGRITVYVNSGGGSVGAGFAMIEMLYKVKRELRIPVDTVILGYAYSMGANVFQAGDHRRMGYFSTMMLHSASWQVSGRDGEVFRDLKKLSDLYQRMSAELFYRRTGLHTPAWWRRFIYSGKERYLSAQECLKLGLVDEVCQFLDECYIVSPLPRTKDVSEGTVTVPV
jgi:ATP-dependent protease ClpP protease subunit